jgi:polar amino acid transport system ATP-binding protein/sulfate transport system ATP-binding protein
MIRGARNGEIVLSVRDVAAYAGDTCVLDGVSFDVVDRIREGKTTGQVVALLGPSGVGKTTLLRILAGLTRPARGEIEAPESIGIVFQDYPLFAHRTVRSNLELAGRLGGLDRARAHRRAEELLARIGLEDRADFWPAQLSGGERQRAAIAQQLVIPRRLLLLDEPFSGLDPAALADVSELVTEVANEHELNTVLLVTHDVHAALAVSDTVLLLARESGKGGARVRDVYDLVDLGFAWGADPHGLADLSRAIERRFQELRS